MADEPLVVVETAEFSVMYILGLDEDADTVEDVDAIVTGRDGTRWTVSLMTHDRIAEVMDRHARSGESANGLYFRVPDLVIMREGGLEAATRALVDLFKHYGMNTTVLPRREVENEDEDE